MGWVPALGVVRVWITAAPAEPEVSGSCAPEQDWRLPGVWQVPLTVPSFAGQQGLARAPWHCPPWTVWLGRGGRGAPVASSGTLTLLCQGFVPCLTGTSVSVLSLYWWDGETLICRINRIREVLFSSGSLSWGATSQSHVVRLEPCALPMARAEDLLPALARPWLIYPLAGVSWGRESLCPGLPLDTLGGGPNSSLSGPASSPVKAPAFPNSGKASGKG